MHKPYAYYQYNRKIGGKNTHTHRVCSVLNRPVWFYGHKLKIRSKQAQPNQTKTKREQKSKEVKKKTAVQPATNHNSSLIQIIVMIIIKRNNQLNKWQTISALYGSIINKHFPMDILELGTGILNTRHSYVYWRNFLLLFPLLFLVSLFSMGLPSLNNNNTNNKTINSFGVNRIIASISSFNLTFPYRLKQTTRS